MDETRIIRGRRVVFERPDPVETLRYSLDVFDEADNLVEVHRPNVTKQCSCANP